jgi:Zn-finger nucleic acid-binding protein
VDVCPTCGGLFLDEGEIKALTGRKDLHELLTKYLGLDSDSQLLCPHCGGVMDGEDVGDVRVDVCLTCHGVWLDAGELERLRQMDDTRFLQFTPEKVDEILRAADIDSRTRRGALRSLFRGLGKR